MKFLCIKSKKQEVSFLVSGSEIPKEGRYYIIEDSATGTTAQNKAFHALVSEYWRCGMHSYSAKSFDEFKKIIKKNLGEGFEAYMYADIRDGMPVLIEVKTTEEIPVSIKRDPRLKERIKGRLKSWSDYSQKQRRETIDRLISEMIQAGVNTQKFDEIITGMETKKQMILDIFNGEVVSE